MKRGWRGRRSENKAPGGWAGWLVALALFFPSLLFLSTLYVCNKWPGELMHQAALPQGHGGSHPSWPAPQLPLPDKPCPASPSPAPTHQRHPPSASMPPAPIRLIHPRANPQKQTATARRPHAHNCSKSSRSSRPAASSSSSSACCCAAAAESTSTCLMKSAYSCTHEDPIGRAHACMSGDKRKWQAQLLPLSPPQPA